MNEVVFVEIPSGSRNKYEYDEEIGGIVLDRRLFTSMSYPADYGYIEETLGEDGDPLDALVLVGEPTFPGCRIRVRPVGVFHMEDEKGPDEKVICVPLRDPAWMRITDIHDIPPELRNEIEHFFQFYKDLEHQKTKTYGLGNRDDVPYYYSYDDAQIVRHFRALIDTVDCPVYAYAIPARAGNELTAAATRELGTHGLRGVKDSTKSRERMHEYLACGVEVLTGTDAFVHEAFAAGAAGCLSALANARPDLLCALRDGGGEDVQADLLEVRARTPFPRLKQVVAERLPSYPVAYRLPLG